MQKRFSIILFGIITGLLFLAAFALAPKTYAADCQVTSAKFVNYHGDQPDSFFASSGANRPHIVIDVQTQNCEGEEIKIRPSDNETDLFTTSEEIITITAGGAPNSQGAGQVEKTYTVPASGLVRAFVKAGETTCDSHDIARDCSYHLRIYKQGSSEMLYSSENQSQGTLRYNCDGVCTTEWTPVSVSGNPLDVCFLMPASLSAHGIQEPGFYSDDQRPQITITIPTVNCAGKTIEVSVTEEDDVTDNDMNRFDNKEIIVPDSETVIIEAKVGDEKCETIEGEPHNCVIHVETWSDNGLHSSTSLHTLKYNCDDNGCNDKGWGYTYHNGVREDGSSVYSGPAGGPPPVDPNDPCAVEGSDGVYTLQDGCYTLLAPLNDTKHINFNDKNNPFTLGDYVNLIVSIAIGIAGVLSVVMIVVGGIQYMTTDALAGKSNARETITKAILGLILALGSYLILKTINPNLLKVEPDINSFSIDVQAWGDIQTMSSQNYEDITGKPLPTDAEIIEMATSAATSVGVEQCVAMTLLAIESNGQAGAIGHDENVQGTRSYNAFKNSDKFYSGEAKAVGTFVKNDDTSIQKEEDHLGLDWRFSHGIGALQVTFFPSGWSNASQYTNSPPAWSTRHNVPTRTLGGTTYTPQQMLDAETNLSAGLSLWKSNYNSCGNNVREAFVKYNGGSCNTSGMAQEYGNLAKATYDNCKSQEQ